MLVLFVRNMSYNASCHIVTHAYPESSRRNVATKRFSKIKVVNGSCFLAQLETCLAIMSS